MTQCVIFRKLVLYGLMLFGQRVTGMWDVIARHFHACSNWLRRADTTVVSEPFSADRKWKILYGDGEKYKFVELNNYSEAAREFQAAIHLATMDSGLFSSKFILMSSEQVLGITDSVSYAKAVRLAAAEQPKAFSGRQ